VHSAVTPNLRSPAAWTHFDEAERDSDVAVACRDPSHCEGDQDMCTMAKWYT
jgi:hypothetical protein